MSDVRDAAIDAGARAIEAASDGAIPYEPDEASLAALAYDAMEPLIRADERRKVADELRAEAQRMGGRGFAGAYRHAADRIDATAARKPAQDRAGAPRTRQVDTETPGTAETAPEGYARILVSGERVDDATRSGE